MRTLMNVDVKTVRDLHRIAVIHGMTSDARSSGYEKAIRLLINFADRYDRELDEFVKDEEAIAQGIE